MSVHSNQIIKAYTIKNSYEAQELPHGKIIKVAQQDDDAYLNQLTVYVLVNSYYESAGALGRMYVRVVDNEVIDLDLWEYAESAITENGAFHVFKHKKAESYRQAIWKESPNV